MRVGRQLGVVVPVSADELPLLADLLALLRIPHQTPLIICPIDGPAPAAAIAEQMGLSPRATLVPIDSAPGHDGCLLAALTAAADRADAAYWALLSPAAIPLHGADLFTGDHWRRFDVVAPAEAFTEIDDLAHTHLRTSGLPLPARIAPGTIVRHTVPGPPISLFSRKAIERLGALPTAMTATAEIGLTLACLGQSLELAVTHVDAGTLGWRT